MKILVLALFGLFSAATLASAQPNFDVSAKKIGDITRWQADNGKTSVTFRGKKNGLFVLDFRRDASRGQPLAVRFWSNRRGELIRAKLGNQTFRYSPSDCSLSLGRCTYVRTDPNGQRHKMIWQALIKNGVWHYALYRGVQSSRTLKERGTFTVDKFGYYIDRDYIVYSRGTARRAWSRRIR